MAQNNGKTTVHIVKGPANVVLNGPCQVLGKDVTDEKVTVRSGKALPFEHDDKCRLDVTLGEGGESWQADPASAGTFIWQDIVQKMRKVDPKIIMLAGDTDSGKSTLSTYLINLAIQRGRRPCLVDADIGQGDLGPPAAIGAAVVEEQILDLSDIRAQHFEFVGDTTPMGFEEIVIKGIKHSLKKLQSTRYAPLVINTDGYVRDNGIDYKIMMTQRLHPDMIICLGQEPFLFDALRQKFSSSLVIQGLSAGLIIKSRFERTERRLSQFLRYVQAEANDWPIRKNLRKLRFVYKDKILAGMPLAKYSSIRIEREKKLRASNMSGMFVGLGLRREIMGFGIIVDVSRTNVTIQTKIVDFKAVYLSNIGITNDRKSEFRISP